MRAARWQSLQPFGLRSREYFGGGKTNVGKKNNGIRQRRHFGGAATMQKVPTAPRYYVRQIRTGDDVSDVATIFFNTRIVSTAMRIRAKQGGQSFKLQSSV